MMQVVDVWKKFSHPNCVTLREVFTTKAFGDNSLILVYDLHAGSTTLLSKYFTPITNGYGSSTGSAFSGDARPFSHKSTLQRTGERRREECSRLRASTIECANFAVLFFPLSAANGPILEENEIWNVIIQLTCGLRAIHQANLACRYDSNGSHTLRCNY
jgi:PAB-dependent poly(A)-specific ribonuclease subunit 3